MKDVLKMGALAVAVLVAVPPLMWLAVVAALLWLPAWLLWGLVRGPTKAEQQQAQETGQELDRAVEAFLVEHMLMDTPQNRARILAVRRRKRRG